MGAVHRLGGRGVVLGATIALAFGMSAGVLFVRWNEAAAAGSTLRASGVPAGISSGPAPVAAPGTEQQRHSPAKASRGRTSDPLARTCGAPGGRLVRYRVSVQEGLGPSRTAFARAVHAILCDRRSWIASERVRFRFDPRARITVSLLDADQTQRRCLRLIGLSVFRKWSCAARAQGQVILNADRWFGGSPSWRGPARLYRAMLVNHEMGHILGHGHRGCPADGARAPVMMQQSKGTAGCRPNPWPTRAELAATR